MTSSSANFDLGQSPILLDEAGDVFTFEDKRMDTKNLGKDVGEYIEENISKEKRKCNRKSVSPLCIPIFCFLSSCVFSFQNIGLLWEGGVSGFSWKPSQNLWL